MEPKMNVLIPKKKGRYDDICQSYTKDDLRCKNKKSKQPPYPHFCVNHASKIAKLTDLPEIKEIIAQEKLLESTKALEAIPECSVLTLTVEKPAWFPPRGEELTMTREGALQEMQNLGVDPNKWSLDKYPYAKQLTPGVHEREDFFDCLLTDCPPLVDFRKPVPWVPEVYDWVKCEGCLTYSLLQAGGCKPCKLLNRLVELPLDAKVI